MLLTGIVSTEESKGSIVTGTALPYMDLRVKTVTNLNPVLTTNQLWFIGPVTSPL